MSGMSTMNMRTTYKVLGFLESKGIKAADIDFVQVDCGGTLDIWYQDSETYFKDVYELGYEITEFLEYLTSE